jgi:small subunit ribosomal protein S9
VEVEGHYYESVGRRKTAIARVRLFTGEGDIVVNDLPASEYFVRERDMVSVREPLETTGTGQSFDISVLVKGGGMTGQAHAVRHGIARALIQADPNLRPTLKQAGFLTRDARAKERKKAGLKRARKAPQYTKR